MSKTIIKLNKLTKNYDDFCAVNELSLDIQEGEFITLLGPSGCGKTTTLRMIGGFEEPTTGDILFEGKKVNEIPANQRNINTVFQKYALFTHLNVYENIAFGPKIRKKEKSVIELEVKEALSIVNLSGFEKRSIDTLSGGQQQRIAIARAIVNKPKVLLLDEPLGALDLKLRQGMQNELKKMHKELGITFIYVTHDQEEALSMSDRVVVMNEGKILQIGNPEDIYNEPKTPFVAEFIGESNIIKGIMKEDYLVNILDTDFKCLDAGFKKDELADVVIRPEDFDIVGPNDGMIKGIVQSITFKGVHYEMLVKSNDYTFIIQNIFKKEIGEEIGMIIIPDHIHVMRGENT